MRTLIFLRNNLGGFIAEPEWRANRDTICSNQVEDWYHVYGKIELISDDCHVLDIRDDLLTLLRHFLLSAVDAIRNGRNYTFEACSYVGTVSFVLENTMVNIRDCNGNSATFSQDKLVEEFLKMAKSGIAFMSTISIADDEDVRNILSLLYHKLKQLDNTKQNNFIDIE